MTREKPNISKLSRKVGEKLRRDKLNTLITNLAEEVPTIKYAQRRPDKLAILRLTVSYLKLHHGLKKRQKVTQCLKSLSCIYGAAKAATNGVIFITTKAGTILYVSENIRNFLGYHQMDVIGYNMDKFIHEADLKTFNSQFIQQSRTLAAFTEEKEGNLFQAVEVYNKNKNYFTMRMLYAAKKRCEGEQAEERYEPMHFSSFLDQHNEDKDCEPWLVAIMKPGEIFSEIEVTVSDFMRSNEFATLHDLDGTVLASDHRASLFHGFMPVEVVGKSPYELVIEEDLQHISRSHQLILKEDEIPVTVYRVHSLLGPHVYLQTKSIIVCDKWTKQPKCIVSVHTAHREEDGKKLLLQQRRRYSLYDLQKSTEETSVDKKSENSSTLSQETTNSTSSFSEKTNKCVQDSHENGKHVDSVDENQNTSSTAEPLCGVFQKVAKKLPDIYSKELMSHKNRNNSGSGVKRPYDDVTENVNESETSCIEIIENSANEFKSSSNSNKFKINSKEVADLDEKSIVGPSLQTRESPRIMSKDKTNTRRKTKLKKPILKGLLEGQLTVNSYIYPDKGPLAMFMRTNEVDNSSASSIDDCQTNNRDSIGASDLSFFQQSLSGTSDNDSDFKSNFVLQLHLKHTQLKDILFEQKNTVQFLRNQLALGSDTVHLDPKNVSVHNNLLGKILEAENQIDVQSGLLREIEEELKV